ncbi:MAG: cytochrome c biogenesis CcdA family protein [Bacillota bacterium]|nr:cytochrome c biogenesis protein CcdA [Candidatus Fermentithermobacillaceae bacterium]
MDLSSPYFGPLYALIAGVLASASPCALAAIPLVIGHMAGTSPNAGKGARVRDLLFFLIGMTSALTFVGVIAAVLGRSLILTAPWIRWVAGLAFLVAGASYLGLVGGSKTCAVPLAIGPDDSERDESRRAHPHGPDARQDAGEHGDVVNPGMDPPGETTSPSWAVRRALSGLTMGALYGLSASPCATPALISILALVAVSGSVSRGVILLFAYSIGQSVLVAASGLATSRFQSVLASSRGLRAVDALRKLGGTVIVGFGLYLILRPYL